MNDKKNSNDVTIWSAIKDGWVNIDAHSWPGVAIFLCLIFIEAAVNIIVSIPKFGIAISVGVGLLFGVFLGAWHIITERPYNSVKQQSVVEFLVNLISGLAIVLIIVNLLRLDGEVILTNSSVLPTGAPFSGWDYMAILVIGIAFASHLFGYLIWHKADNRRASLQNYNRKIAIVKDAEKDAELAGQRAEVRLMALEAALGKEDELRVRYASLPKDKLDRIIREAIAEVYAAFEKTYNMDLDDSGGIGDKKQPAQSTPRPAYAASTTAPVPEIVERTTSDNGNGHTPPKGGAGQ